MTTRNALRLVALLLLALMAAVGAPPRAAAQEAEAPGEEWVIERGSLSEIRDKKRALLVVSRSLSIDIRGTLHGVLEEVFGEPPRPSARHHYALETITKKLGRYARDYQGLTFVETMEEADFIIVYKALAEHRSFSPDEPFVYGQMFVFLKRTPERPHPVLLWRTRGERTAPGDAASDLIKALKAVRGER